MSSEKAAGRQPCRRPRRPRDSSSSTRRRARADRREPVSQNPVAREKNPAVPIPSTQKENSDGVGRVSHRAIPTPATDSPAR